MGYEVTKRKHQHESHIVIPETSEDPVVVICGTCWKTKHINLKQLPPADDVIAAVERIMSERS
jgi:hypothetical protein